MKGSVSLKDKLTVTHFQVQKPISSLLVSADIKEGEMVFTLLYDPNGLLCGIICGGMSNFVNEIYISDTLCTLNGRLSKLMQGEYTLVFFPVPSVPLLWETLEFEVEFDAEREYDKKYCYGKESPEIPVFDEIVCAENRYYKGDLHGHTIFSDGHNSILEAAAVLEEQKLDYMAFTEHNSIAFYPGELPCLSIPSFELTLPMGHMNIHGVVNLDSLFKSLTGLGSFEELWDNSVEYFQENSNLSLNHPFLEPWQFHYGTFDMSKLNTIEIICDPTYPSSPKANDKAVAFLDHLWSEGVQLYAVGGSDSHNKKDELYEGVWEPSIYGDPATYVYCRGLSVNHLLEGIKKGNSYVARYLELDIRICQGRYLPGDRIEEEEISYSVLAKNMDKNYMGRYFLNGEIVKEAMLSPEHPEITFHMKACKDRWWLRFGIYDLEGHVIAYVNPIYNREKECRSAEFAELLADLENQSDFLPE